MPLISLYIDKKIKDKVKMLGIRHAAIYERGFDAIVNKQDYEAAIAELRKKLERLSHLLDHYIVKSTKLEDELMEMKKNGKIKKMSKM